MLSSVNCMSHEADSSLIDLNDAYSDVESRLYISILSKTVLYVRFFDNFLTVDILGNGAVATFNASGLLSWFGLNF